MSLNSRTEEYELQPPAEENLISPCVDSVATDFNSTTADIPATIASSDAASSSDQRPILRRVLSVVYRAFFIGAYLYPDTISLNYRNEASTDIVSSFHHLQNQVDEKIIWYLESFTVFCYFTLVPIAFHVQRNELDGFLGPSFLMWLYCGLSSIRQLNIPKPGEHYTYIYKTYGPLLAFLYLWSATVIFVPSINAMLGLTFASCVSQLLLAVGCSVPTIGLKLFAAVTICALTYINAYDVRVTYKIRNVFMFTRIGSLLLVIVVGVVWMAVADDSMDHIESALHGSEINVNKFFALLIVAMGSYGMMTQLNRLQPLLSRADELTVVCVMGLYFVFNVIHLSILTPQDILSSDAIAMTFALRTMSYGWLFMPIVVSIAMCIALHMHIMASSHMFFVESPNGHMPEILSNINVTPKSCLWFLCVLSILYLFISDMYVLNIFSTFAETVYTMLSVGSVLNFHYNLLHIRWKFCILLLVLLPVLMFIPEFYQIQEVFMVPEIVVFIVLPLLDISFYYIAKCTFCKNKCSVDTGILPENVP